MSRTYSSNNVDQAHSTLAVIKAERQAIKDAIALVLAFSLHADKRELDGAMERINEALDDVYYDDTKEAERIVERDEYEDGSEYRGQVESYYQSTRI